MALMPHIASKSKPPKASLSTRSTAGSIRSMPRAVLASALAHIGDEPCAAAVRKVGPDPLHQYRQPVTRADQKGDMCGAP